MRITGRMESKLRVEFERFAVALLDSGDCVDHGSVAEVRGLITEDGVVKLTMSAGGAVVMASTAASERYVVDELVSMTHRMVEVLSA